MDVAVIGGGPVGLCAALMHRSRGDRVTVYEKRQEYTRKQNVNIDPSALTHLSAWMPSTECIRLSVLESHLWKKAKALGVRRVTVTVLTPPIADRIIVATGSKGPLADRMFGPVEEAIDSRTVNVVRLVTPEPRMDTMLNRYKTSKILGSPIVEQVTKKSVTLIWEEGTTDAEEGARLWLHRRREMGDEVCKDTVHFDQYTSTTYARTRFVKKTARVVGDAAIGVPYFRSLQLGLQNLQFLFYPDEEYETAMSRSAMSALTRSLSISRSLSFASIFLEISSHVPWQVVRWSDEWVEKAMTTTIAGI